MHRYFVDNKINNKISIYGNDFFHIKNVVKLKESEQIECVFENKLFLCKIVDIEIKEIKCEVINEILTKNSNVELIAYVAILREQKFDYVLQKLCEIGVSQIYPVEFERNVARIKKENEIKKISRWKEILLSAAKQSKRIDIPKINNIIRNIKEIDSKSNLNIVAWEEEKSLTIKDLQKDINKFNSISFVIGPEGGIAEKEINILKEKKFKMITLGNNILRAETASIYLLSILSFLKN